MPKRQDQDGDDPNAERMDPAFFLEVMKGLEQTNFARGWANSAMYHDFLAWCEHSEEADAIIAGFFPRMPTLVLDEDGVRMISLQADVATELMKALLDAFEEQRIRELLSR